MSLHLCSYCRKSIPDIELAARTEIADDECHCDHVLTAIAVRQGQIDARKEIAKTRDITRDELARYLDGAIWAWRQKRDDPNNDGPDLAQAKAYIDAYQSVRVSMLGVCVPAADGTPVVETTAPDAPDPDSVQAREIADKIAERICEQCRHKHYVKRFRKAFSTEHEWLHRQRACTASHEREAIIAAIDAAHDEGAKAKREVIDVRGLSDEMADRVCAAMIEARKRMHPVGGSALVVFARLFRDDEHDRDQQEGNDG